MTDDKMRVNANTRREQEKPEQEPVSLRAQKGPESAAARHTSQGRRPLFRQ
jgi:hypothetical protein